MTELTTVQHYWPTTCTILSACIHCGHLIHPGQTLYTSTRGHTCKDCTHR
jgi:DNA-directed RNA polymerase subunit RPC12/RpoP